LHLELAGCHQSLRPNRFAGASAGWPRDAMKLSRVVILAAGQGSRLGELTRHCHKSLLPVAGEPLLVRTVRQLYDRGFDDITVVAGHLRESIASALSSFESVKRVDNPFYATDANRGSLLRGLGTDSAPALVIEADVALDDFAADELASVAATAQSTWFTNGYFQPHQLGGILRADGNGQVTDLRYTALYDEKLAQYRKLLGVLQIGTAEQPLFQRLLREAAGSTPQYYMMPWVRRLASLPCRAHDLAHCRTATFNTPEDYRRCQELFAHPVSLAGAA